MVALVLRPYQTDIIDKVRAHMMKGERRILIVSPTGSGKTALTANMLGTAASKGMVSWFNVHRRELVKQSMMAFHKADVYHGIVANGFHFDPAPNVHVTSVQTLQNRYDKLKKPKLIIWDECHHVAAKSWDKIFQAFPDSFHIGLTATPERLDGKGLGDWFNTIVMGPKVDWLIENNYLVPYRIFAPPSGVDLTGIKTRMGDYAKGELSKRMDVPHITGCAIREYKKKAIGKRAVVFCVSVAHSIHVVEQFRADGIPAAHVDGTTDKQERDYWIEEFRQGRIHVLSNVDLFGEGFDLPAIEVLIMLRPTQSLSMYLQQVGRSLRTNEGKTEALILDHVDNVARHGLPDEERNWTLEDREKRKKTDVTDEIKVRLCDKCYATFSALKKECPECGSEIEPSPREIEEREGELVEIDPQQLKREKRKQQGSAQSMDDLVKLGIARGYKRPRAWAKHVFNARQAKRIGR